MNISLRERCVINSCVSLPFRERNEGGVGHEHGRL